MLSRETFDKFSSESIATQFIIGIKGFALGSRIEFLMYWVCILKQQTFAIGTKVVALGSRRELGALMWYRRSPVCLPGLHNTDEDLVANGGFIDFRFNSGHK